MSDRIERRASGCDDQGRTHRGQSNAERDWRQRRVTVTVKNAFDRGESSRVSCISRQGMTRAPAPKISGPVRFVIAVAEESTIVGDLLGTAELCDLLCSQVSTAAHPSAAVIRALPRA